MQYNRFNDDEEPPVDLGSIIKQAIVGIILFIFGSIAYAIASVCFGSSESDVLYIVIPGLIAGFGAVVLWIDYLLLISYMADKRNRTTGVYVALGFLCTMFMPFTLCLSLLVPIIVLKVKGNKGGNPINRKNKF